MESDEKFKKRIIESIPPESNHWEEKVSIVRGKDLDLIGAYFNVQRDKVRR